MTDDPINSLNLLMTNNLTFPIILPNTTHPGCNVVVCYEWVSGEITTKSNEEENKKWRDGGINLFHIIYN